MAILYYTVVNVRLWKDNIKWYGNDKNDYVWMGYKIIIYIKRLCWLNKSKDCKKLIKIV